MCPTLKMVMCASSKAIPKNVDYLQDFVVDERIYCCWEI